MTTVIKKKIKLPRNITPEFVSCLEFVDVDISGKRFNQVGWGWFKK